MTTARIYLASASPRRRELLLQIGLGYICVPQDVDESVLPGEDALQYVSRLAAAKARSAMVDPLCSGSMPVLAADTAVVVDGRILGKPESAQQAAGMLAALAGTTHEVLTAIAVASTGQLELDVVSTLVTFREITAGEIAAYWQSGEPCDKAGAYGIQGKGALFVSRIEGSYTNVVGLPLFETMQLLDRHGINTTSVLCGVKHEC